MISVTLHFWTAFVAGIFILLHIPSCDVHWAKVKAYFNLFVKISQNNFENSDYIGNNTCFAKFIRINNWYLDIMRCKNENCS